MFFVIDSVKALASGATKEVECYKNRSRRCSSLIIRLQRSKDYFKKLKKVARSQHQWDKESIIDESLIFTKCNFYKTVMLSKRINPEYKTVVNILMLLSNLLIFLPPSLLITLFISLIIVTKPNNLRYFLVGCTVRR